MKSIVAHPSTGPTFQFPSAVDNRVDWRLPVLTVGALAFLACAFVAAAMMHLDLMNRWLERSYMLMFPLIGAVSAYGLLNSTKRRNDLATFRFAALIFVAAFGTLACSFWPFMIPFAFAVEQAASPLASLNFMFGAPAYSSCHLLSSTPPWSTGCSAAKRSGSLRTTRWERPMGLIS
jgi:hypothetical protein